jgi:hypothetical protein
MEVGKLSMYPAQQVKHEIQPFELHLVYRVKQQKVWKSLIIVFV